MRGQPVFRSLVALAATAILAVTGATIAAADEPNPPFSWVPPVFMVGQAKVGVTLSIYGGIPIPEPAPDDVEVEWLVNGAVESTDFTYPIEPPDLGKSIQLRVTFIAAGYQNATAYSDATGPVVAGTQAFTPAITGATAVGSTLKATGLAPDAASSFQWRRNGAAISGAKASTYKLTSSDLGKKVTVTVTATRVGYTTLAKTSAATATIKKAFAATHAPKITGTAKVGYTLKATTSPWSPAATFTYQWYRDGIAIAGATGATRKLSGADATHKITVKVKGSRSGYYALTKTSAATAAVAKASISAGAPTISGTAQAGHNLKVTPAASTPSSATKTYAWYRNGTLIAGATDSTYALKNVDTGNKITAKVTYSLTGYVSRTVTSAATATIALRAPSALTTGSYTLAGIEDTQVIAPGMYYTTTATSDCRWGRTDLRWNDWLLFHQGAERWIVELHEGDFDFYTEECGDWIAYDGTGPQATSLTQQGMYLVGADIKEGLWQLSVTSNACLAAKSVATTGPGQIHVWTGTPAEPGSLVSLANGNLFRSWSGCGTWTRIGDIP